eukprot:c18598_g1_i1 orf=195-401(+)
MPHLLVLKCCGQELQGYKLHPALYHIFVSEITLRKASGRTFGRLGSNLPNIFESLTLIGATLSKWSSK